MKVKDVVRKLNNRWIDQILTSGFKRYKFFNRKNDTLPLKMYTKTGTLRIPYTEDDLSEEVINDLRKCEDYDGPQDIYSALCTFQSQDFFLECVERKARRKRYYFDKEGLYVSYKDPGVIVAVVEEREPDPEEDEYYGYDDFDD